MEDRKRLDNPIVRFRLFLEARGWWTKEEEAALGKRFREEVIAAYKKAEALPKPEVKEMFTEVYGGEEPWHIVSVYRTRVGRLVRELMTTVLCRGSSGRSCRGW